MSPNLTSSSIRKCYEKVTFRPYLLLRDTLKIPYAVENFTILLLLQLHETVEFLLSVAAELYFREIDLSFGTQKL